MNVEKNPRQEIKNEEILLAELGRFVVEFEDMLHNTKLGILFFFENNELIDKTTIEILLHDSTSRPLADHYKSIAMHHLINKKKNNKNFNQLKTIVNKISKHINEAGELRNEIVHSSWSLSACYSHIQLEASRIKPTNGGIEMRILKMRPGLFTDVLRMLRELSDFVRNVSLFIISDNVDFEIENMDQFNLIDFKKERESLFINDTGFFSSTYENYKDMKKSI